MTEGIKRPDMDASRETQESAESVQFLKEVLGLLKTPETAPETEQEIKSRRRLNELVHRALIAGLALSTVILLGGLTLSAVTRQPLPGRVAGFGQIVAGLKTGSPAGFLSLGILLLIATPILRILGSLIEFIGKRDWRYALVTILVLLILGASFIAGGG